MKKFLGLFIFFILVLVALKIDYGNRVFEIKNPAEIFIDLNNNLIFDEKEPVVIPNIYFITSETDYEKYPLLKQLSDEEKFFLEYKAIETANNLLKNRYVKVKNGDILIDNESYTEQILSTKFVFSDFEKSQQELIDNIKSINLDDYVILNLKNKKYHKLNCEMGRKSAKYRIVKVSELPENSVPCKNCSLPVQNDNKPEFTAPKVIEDFENSKIKIFFIDLNKTFKPDNSCKEPACRELKNLIDNAQISIDYAVYGLNNQPKILNALINAHKRGVKIRRVYDYSPKKYYEDNDKLDELITSFKTDETYDKNHDSALMHNKYFIIDDKTVWTGSSNISSTDLSGFNSNYVVTVDSQDVALKYKSDFEQMYGGIFHKGKEPSNPEFIQISEDIKIKPLFSPQDDIINSEIIPLINKAQKYIYIPIFFITDKGMENALINAHNRGVEVKVINDATNAHTKYTIHKNLRNSGIKVKTENYAGKMHSKAIIADDKYTVTGSMNYTKSGNSRNDENVLIIESPEIAKYMRSTFMYLWNKIPEKYETFDPKAESTESLGSCFDGIDNDFDDKIDMEDEGCFIKNAAAE